MDTNTHATAYTTRMTERNVDDVSSRVDEIMKKYWADKEASHNNREKQNAHNNREKQKKHREKKKKQKAILEAALMQSSRNTEAALVDNLPIPVEKRKCGRPLGSKNVQFKTEKTKRAVLDLKALNSRNDREKQKKQKAILEAALGRVQLEGVSMSKELLENAEKALKDNVKQKALLASALARVEELEGEASIEERHHAFIRAVIDRKDKEIAMLLSQNDDSQAEITKLRLLLS